jgi:hypothetical protein
VAQENSQDVKRKKVRVMHGFSIGRREQEKVGT